METDTTQMTTLERNIFGDNLINRLTIENLKKVLPQLEKFIGQKVRLATGKQSAKFNIELLKVKDLQLRTYIHIENQRIELHQDINIAVKTDSNNCTTVQYHKNILWDIAKVNWDGVLTEVSSLAQIIHSYKLDKVININQVQTAIKKIEALKSDIKALEGIAGKYIDRY